MRLETIKQYWQEAYELTADLLDEQFSTPELVSYLNEHRPSGSELMTKTKVNYLRVQEILKPEGDGDTRTSWRYGRDDVRRALVVELLKTRAKLSIQEIKGWLRSFEEAQSSGVLSKLEQSTLARKQPDMPDPISLAYALLRNRVLGSLVAALSYGEVQAVPPGCLIAIHSGRDKEASELNWEEARCLLEDGSWYLAVADSWYLPAPNPFPKLYMYPDLKQLQSNRLELDDEKLNTYYWYTIILHGTDDRAYQVVIGLPDVSTQATAAIDKALSQLIENELNLDLSSFPGFTTLLRSAFIVRPRMEEGTTLSVLTEIIATASDAWDYCAVLVPRQSVDRMEEWLYIQECSSEAPPYLKDKQVKVGQFLPGWCYRYGQSFLVEPIIENDPRIPFYDEDYQIEAAAAVPAIAEDQQIVGVIYIAKCQRTGEKGMGFSEEVLASLKAFGYICGDIIARDKIEAGTVRSLARLSNQPSSSYISFPNLKDLLRRVVDEVQREISPVNAAHSWIYLLTLNIQIPAQGTLTEWLCQQAIEVTSNFLAHYLRNLPYPDHLPIGQCQIGPNQYIFAILHPIDLPEEVYKEASLRLQQELSHIYIGRLAPDFYSWAITFRCKDIGYQLHEKDRDSLLNNMVERTLGALIAGPYIKRGHEALRRHDLDEAVSQFEDALRVLRYAPSSWYVYKHLAEARMLQGTEGAIEQAVEMCRKALKLNPDYASAHCLLADCLSYQGKFDEAVIEYERTLMLDNTRRSFLTRYGLALAGMAISEYKETLNQLRQEGPELVRQRNYYDTPWEEAIDKFDRVQKLSAIYNDTPEQQREYRANYHYQRGYAYLQAGLLNKAVEDFAVGRKLAPENMQLVQAYSYALSLRRKQESKQFSTE